LEHLDLSACNEIYENFREICDWYDEAVANSKFYIRNFINTKLEESDQQHLLIILGAGKSPLALDIICHNSEKIDRILEIDSEWMDEKKEIYDRLFPSCSQKIKCITADITSSTMLKLLNTLLHEFYDEHPCIIVLESETPYLSRESLEKIVTSLKSKNGNNTILIEHLLPEDMVSEEKKEIPQKVYEKLKQLKRKSEINYYTNDLLMEIFLRNGGELKKRNTMCEIEKMRLGKNRYFPRAEDGWSECSIWQI
jgi:O-methyltransferase involved in polyketide biosynthesis